MKIMNIRATVSYPWTGSTYKDMIVYRILKKTNGISTGSGCGFGQRDISVEFVNENDYNNFVNRISPEEFTITLNQ